jgi:formylglycine-generating enzyme required for sulfatase activity
VDSFWIDETPGTNAEFAAFVTATSYVTRAEIAPDPEVPRRSPSARLRDRFTTR